MADHVKLLKYWRNSLIDAGRINARISKTAKEITPDELESGRIDVKTVQLLYKETKNGQQFEEIDDEKYIPVLLCPVQLKAQVFHGRKSTEDRALLWIPADLMPTGELRPRDGEYPWISRALLEPSLGEEADLTIGRLEDVESYMQNNSPEVFCKEWQDLLEYGRKMIEFVTGNKEVTGYKWQFRVYIILDDDKRNPARHIIKLLDTIIKEKQVLPLLEKYLSLTDTPTVAAMSFEKMVDQTFTHSGQMTSSFPLAPSQREALYHFLTLNQGEILAVNGPPGTGKTTLLQSIIATLWVDAALQQTDPPIIVAASTNNQAVTNIIESFGKVLQKTQGDPLEKRWLPEVESYGLYFPASNQSEEVKTRFQIALADAEFPARSGFPGKVEALDYIDAATNFFLGKCRDCFGTKIQTIDDALYILHHELEKYINMMRESINKKKDVVLQLNYLRINLENFRSKFDLFSIDLKNFPDILHERWQKIVVQETELLEQLAGAEKDISTLTAEYEKWINLKEAWHFHKKSEPFWWRIVWFLPKIKKKRQARLALFVQQHGLKQTYGEIEYFILVGTRTALDNKILKEKKRAYLMKERLQIVKQKQEIEEAQEKIQELLQKLTETEKELNDFLDEIDTTLRYKAFLLATHYWEARWLKEVKILHKLNEKGKIPSGREKKKLKLKLYAMLTPCMVATFFMLPKVFSASSPPGSTEKKIYPLYSFADLLIIDEAGQVLPSVAAPAFALAQKALVVGDRLQIEPVYEIPKSVDMGNLVRYGVIQHTDNLDEKYDELKAKGVAVSSGCVMTIAQRACRYQKYDSTGRPYPERGMFLREHYRCLDIIIHYCNRLAYDGRLEPKRGSCVSPGALPPFGYLNVSGQSQYIGGSRNNEEEANAILEWLLVNKDRLEDIYGQGKKRIYEIVAIVTPFVAQKKLINDKLKIPRYAVLKGKSKKDFITAGTVHALQGAERDVVIFSPVCTSKDGNPADFFFNRSKNMLNVAVSRAMKSFLVFGDLNVFKYGDSCLPSYLLGEYLFSKPENNLSRWATEI